MHMKEIAKLRVVLAEEMVVLIAIRDEILLTYRNISLKCGYTLPKRFRASWQRKHHIWSSLSLNPSGISNRTRSRIAGIEEDGYNGHTNEHKLHLNPCINVNCCLQANKNMISINLHGFCIYLVLNYYWLFKLRHLNTIDNLQGDEIQLLLCSIHPIVGCSYSTPHPVVH